MRIVYIVLGILCGILGLALSIMPFEKMAFIPIILGFICGLLAMKIANKEGNGKSVVKFIFLLLIIALGFSIYRTIFDKNVVENDIETIKNEEESLEDAKNDLEGLEIDE